MLIGPDAESKLLAAIRRCPSSDADRAWAYAASRLRPIAWPTMRDVDDICREVVSRYGGYVKEEANGQIMD